MKTLRTDARWHAVVQYRTGTKMPKNVEIYLNEIGDIHDHIENGPHWDTVEIVKIRRVNHIENSKPTLKQAAELGRRTVRQIALMEASRGRSRSRTFRCSRR